MDTTQTSTPNKVEPAEEVDAKGDESDPFEYNMPLPPLPLSDEASVSESETIKSPASPASERADKESDTPPSEAADEEDADQGQPPVVRRRRGVVHPPPALEGLNNDVEEKRKSGITDSGFTDSTACSTPGSIGERKISLQDLNSVSSDSKRSSALLSTTSLSSSDADIASSSYTSPPDSMVFPDEKESKRKKDDFGENELRFLQDPLAAHSGILLQKRMLGVWIKRFCKILDNRLKCFRYVNLHVICLASS